MLRYEPGKSIAHRLDPRSKLLVQGGFAAAAFAYTTPRGLVILTLLALCVLALSRTAPHRVLWEFRFVFPFLLAAPVLEGISLDGLVISDATSPALASYRVLLVLLVAGAYIRTTSVRDSRAAIQRSVPGRPGQFLGMGVGFVFRFLPVLRADIGRIRDGYRSRLGTERSVPVRMRILLIASLNRAFERADRFSLALRARCFSWNPTLPTLRFSRIDVPAIGFGLVLFLAAVYGFV